MISRRRFLRLGAVIPVAAVPGGAALAAVNRGGDNGEPWISRNLLDGGKDYSFLRGIEKKAIPSACWQCPSRCPILGFLEAGRLTNIEGQPNSIRSLGKVCAKGQAGINQLFDPDRVLYPMRRTGERGAGQWKRISWDEALEDLVSGLKKLRDDGRPEKFMFHHGQLTGGSNKLMHNFLAAYGTATIGNHESLSAVGKWTAQELTWGGVQDNWDFDRTNFVLNFGSNVFEAHTNHIPTAQRLIRAMVERGVRMVTFDVRLSNTAAKSTEWVPVKPGTDLAVVLAMCHVIMKEDLYKGEGEAFLQFCKVTPDHEASTDDKIAALKKHLAAYTPAWAAKISGVPAEKVSAIARQFATSKPACVISYRGAVAHYNGTETERAIQMLAAITGNIDNPGGRCQAITARWDYPQPKNIPEAKKLDILDGFDKQVLFPTHHVSHQILDRIKDGRAGRPDIYLWYCYSPVYANGNCKANMEILKDESLLPFTVAVSPFYDESAALADLILPDTTYLERWDWEDMASPAQIPEYCIRQPLASPLGEARHFADVCGELAKRLELRIGADSMLDFVKKSCKLTKIVKKKARGFRGMIKKGVWHDKKAKPIFYAYQKEIPAKELQRSSVLYDEVTGVYWDWKKSAAESEEAAQQDGYTKTPSAYHGYVGQRVGDKVYTGFRPGRLNKSGYFELYSTLMEQRGLPPVPTFVGIPEHEQIQDNQLILTTYKVNVHSQSRSMNCGWLAELYHDNPAWINVITAETLGITDGDSIKVASEIGEIVTKVQVTPAIAPGVIAMSHHCGHWEYGRFASGKWSPQGMEAIPNQEVRWWKTKGVHPNWVIPNSADPVSGQQRWMDTVVTVSKFPAGTKGAMG